MTTDLNSIFKDPDNPAGPGIDPARWYKKITAKAEAASSGTVAGVLSPTVDALRPRGGYLQPWRPGVAETPTAVTSAKNAAPTITGGPTYYVDDPTFFTSFGGQIGRSIPGAALHRVDNGLSSNGVGWFEEFCTDAQAMELYFSITDQAGGQLNGAYKLFVDGLPTTQFAKTYATTGYTGGYDYYIEKITFASAKVRLVSLLLCGGFAGIGIPAGAGVWKTKRKLRGTIAYLGQSWGGNESSGSAAQVWPYELMLALGSDNILVYAQGGTGYIANAGGGDVNLQNYQNRIATVAAAAVAAGAEMLVIDSPINDSTVDNTNLTAAAANTYAIAAATAPNLPIVVMGSPYTPDLNSGSWDAIDAKLAPAVAAAPNVKGIISSSGWLTGRAAMVAADNRHLGTPLATQYWASRVAQGVKALGIFV